MKSRETRAPERRASLGLVERVKLAAVVVGGIGVWLWAYESVGAYASRLPAHDFSTPLDRALPVVPSAVFVYLLCYVLPLLPVLVVRERRALVRAALAAVLLNVLAFATYVTLPVGFPRPHLADSWPEQVLSFVYSWEFTPGANNMPSLHVAMSWLVWRVCRPYLSLAAGRWLLFLVLSIFVSTLLVKQHILVDVLTGVPYAQLALASAQRVLSARRVAALAPD